MVAGYRLEGVLGQGRMGIVYRATDAAEGRTVAVKLLTGEFSGDPEYRARFRREGALQAGLEHRHIVPVFDSGECEHGLFIALRLVAGPNLKELITEGGMPTERSIQLLFPIADALEVAHRAGVVHRDMKPQNILIGDGDHPYLADFGLLKALGEETLPQPGTFIGTIDYVSPEQVLGDPVTPASDAYGLTCVLYEALTGQVPFPRFTAAATMFAHVSSPPPRVTEARPELPAELDDVIALGMGKDPAARPAPTDVVRSAALALGFLPPPVMTLDSPPRVTSPAVESGVVTVDVMDLAATERAAPVVVIDGVA
jgi:serine/threonine protein kinase